MGLSVFDILNGIRGGDVAEKNKTKQNKYNNANEKIDIQDQLGYKYSVTFNNIKETTKNNTGFNKYNPNNPYSIDNINLFLKLNVRTLKLLSNTYISFRTHLIWQCDRGHIFPTLLGNILQGHGCSYCAGQGKPTPEFIYGEFKKRNYKLFPFIYTNNLTKLKYICLKHEDKGIQEIDWAHFRIGNGCYYCGREKLAQSLTKTTEVFKSQVEELASNEYIVLEDYIKGDIPIKMFHIICGNTFMMAPSNFIGGNRCSYCNLSIDACKIWMYLKNH